jgi:hypothetical protein
MAVATKIKGLTIAPCSWITHVLWMAQGKIHSTLDFKGPCQAHHQWIMFDPCAHKVDLCKQGELDPNLSSNKKLSVWVDLLLQCIIHVPKKTQINQWKFWASTKVEFQAHY